MNETVYYESGATRAPDNLALEEALAEAVGRGAPGCFMLWQNAPAVIIGRHQNAYSEVNLGELARRGCDLVRRMTGGGAVYHDLGNLNFSFILPLIKNQEPKTGEILAPLIDFFGSQGLNVVMEGRNDLSIPGQGKFSGLAGRRLPGGWQLHGTIMYDVDTGVLEKVLLVDPAKYRSKGVASVRARVTNLKPHLGISLAELWTGLKEAYGFSARPLPDEIRKAARELADRKYSREAWNIGQSPPTDVSLKRRFPFGSLELHLSVKKNEIMKARLTGDFLTAGDTEIQLSVDELEKSLLGLPADHPERWASAWSGFDLSKFFHGQVNIDDIKQWLSEGRF